jgi:hypothetical protein
VVGKERRDQKERDSRNRKGTMKRGLDGKVRFAGRTGTTRKTGGPTERGDKSRLGG